MGKQYWSWPFLHISIDLWVAVANRISANHRISGLAGKAGQEFPPNIGFSRRSKRFLHICTVGLGPKISALQVHMVKNVKFDHDFGTIF